jgi:hypothetical protein
MVEKKERAPRPGALFDVMIYNLPAIPTAAATASLAATATTTATETTAGASFLGARFIDRQSPAAKIAAVKRLDRLLSFV